MITPTQIKILAAALILAALCYVSYDYGVSSTTAAWNDERARINAKTAEVLTKLNDDRKVVEEQLQQSERDAWKEYENAQSENDSLNRELTDRPWRVRVESNTCGELPGDSESSSMGDGKTEQYAELPAETARNVIAIGRDADQCEAKLKALQDYISTLNRLR